MKRNRISDYGSRVAIEKRNQTSCLGIDKCCGNNNLPAELWGIVVSLLDLNSKLSLQNTSFSFYHFIWESETTLKLYNRQITDDQFIALLRKCNIRNLHTIHICFRSDGITNTAIRFLERFKNLTTLNFGNCRFQHLTDTGVAYLGALTNLTHLNLHHCVSLTPSATLKSISGLTNLQTLLLDVNEDVNFKLLTRMTKLQSLSLWAFKNLESEKIPLRRLPPFSLLTQLTLLWFNFSELSPEYINLKNYPSLISLSLCECCGLDTLSKDISTLSQLHQLKLNESVVSPNFATSLTTLSKLSVLHLGNYTGSFGALVNMNLDVLIFDRDN